MKVLLSILIVALVPSVARSRDAQYEVVATIVLPAGDAAAGRRAFEDLKCHACHRVTGEGRLPAPIAEAQGPDLDATLVQRDASEIAEAIIAPSHSVSVRTSAAVKARLAREMKSPMGDFSRTLTVRQLADLLAYLRSVR